MLKFLKGEILEEIKEMYTKDSPYLAGHRWEEHILPVIAEAQNICKLLGEEYTIEIELGCALHDIGLAFDRKQHHRIGASMARMYLDMKYQDEVDKSLVIEMILHHRASNELIRFCSKPIQIVNMADRGFTISDTTIIIDNIVRRSYIYATETLGLSHKEAASHVIRHMSEKYGITGYAYQNPLISEVFEKKNGEKFGLTILKELLSGAILRRIEKIHQEMEI